MTNRLISAVSIVVPTYEAGLACYRDKLDFVIVDDVDMGEGKRFLVLSPQAEAQTRIVLAQAKSQAERDAVGNQTGGRVGFFLSTDDFDRDHKDFLNKGIHFKERPRDEPYGKVAVFEDDFGNLWDLIQHK